MTDSIARYVSAVAARVPHELRWRITAEVEDHLREAAGAYVAQGVAEPQAQHSAIQDFGPPWLVAEGLDWRTVKGMIELVVVGVRTQRSSDDATERVIAVAKRQWPVDAPASAQEAPVILLKQKDRDRYLPIWVGEFEGSAIASALEGTQPPRPYTHDFCANIVRALEGVAAKRAVVTRLDAGTFFAELVVEHAGREVSIDARPSDAIATAVRLGIPVYASEDLGPQFLEASEPAAS